MNSQEYNNVLGLVIDNLEGGYYHPNMLKDGRVKDSNGLYSAGPGRVASGETMYGLDRVNGGSLNTSQAGKKFWAIIDNADAKNTWKWNYNGGALAPQLNKLAAQMMYPAYNALSNKYLSDAARPLVNSDNRLVFHFGYATWNGPAFFSRFAKTINNAVVSGITDVDKLASIAAASRTESSNELIKMSSGKIARIMQSMKSFTAMAVDKAQNTVVAAKKNPVVTIVIIVTLAVAAYLVVNKLRAKK